MFDNIKNKISAKIAEAEKKKEKGREWKQKK